VLIYSLPDFTLTDYISLPQFNDLHHVRPTSTGSLAVANTGLDQVVEMSREGRVLRLWSAVGGDPWDRFDPERDYRKVDSTKPHRSHPNYVFEVGEDLWGTRFEQRDALCLTGGGRIAIDVQRPHDGITMGDKVYFTTVNGCIVIASLKTL